MPKRREATHGPILIKVWGKYACFTSFKADERFSHPMMTPSAAAAILRAILWEPQFQYELQEIWLLKPIQYFDLMRNEVVEKTNVSSLLRGVPFFVEDHRVQRHSLILSDVAYVIVADVELYPHNEERSRDPGKYRSWLRRRLNNGQQHRMPYFGCREFSVDGFEEFDGSDKPLDLTMYLGKMLFDIDYYDDKSGRGEPKFFSANLERGVMKVPTELYPMLRWWPRHAVATP